MNQAIWDMCMLLKRGRIWGVSQNFGYHFGGPNNRDYSIMGSILGSPNFEKLPFKAEGLQVWGAAPFCFRLRG